MPTLLSASAEALEAALQLFDPEHIASLAEDGRRLLDAMAVAGYPVPAAWQRLQAIEVRAERDPKGWTGMGA